MAYPETHPDSGRANEFGYPLPVASIVGGGVAVHTITLPDDPNVFTIETVPACEPQYNALHIYGRAGSIAVISPDGKVTLAEDINLEDLKRLDLPYLYLLREIIGTAIYDAERR